MSEPSGTGSARRGRRRFLEWMGLGAATAVVGPRALGAAGGAPPAVSGARVERARERPERESPVAFVKTGDRSEGVRRAVALLRLEPLAGRSVLVKPNFNSADPAPGSTHPDVLRALVAALREQGAGPLTVGDRSGMGDSGEVMRRLGLPDLAKELGFETLAFDALPAEDWVRVRPQGGHWSRGFWVPRPLVDAGAVVQACCLKTHRFGGHFTLSLKNAVGIAAKRVPGDPHDYMQELHGSRWQRHMIAEVNTAWRPRLIVLDGVEAFTHGGPESGRRVRTEVVLAGSDPVAIDAVGVALLRLHGTTEAVARGRIWEQDQLARAVELGLGAAGPGAVHLVTGDPESEAYARRVRAVLDEG